MSVLKNITNKLNKPSNKQTFKKFKAENIKMPKTLLSIEIGSKFIKIVIGRHKKNIVEIDKAYTIKTPENISFDGTISNSFEVERTIKEFIEKNNIKVKDAVCTVDSSSIIKRELIIPEVPDEDINGIVSYEIGKYLPIDASSYVIQSKKVGLVIDEKGRKLRVSVGAVPKSMIEFHLKIFEYINFNPFAMSINSNSIEKLIQLDISSKKDSEFKDTNAVFVDMGHSCFNISIFEKGNFLFNRVAPMGGRMIDEKIIEILNIDSIRAEEFKINLSSNTSIFQMAAKNKGKYNLDIQNQSQLEVEKIQYEMLIIVDYWINEIKKVFQYYITRDRNNKIDKIYLYGGCSFIKDIDGYFERMLNIKTNRLLNPHIEILDYKPTETSCDVPNYINVFGALIRS